MKITIIDNYDSFTYNLAHLVKALGAEVTVFRNDKFRMEQLEDADKLILSPGPGIPEEAGLLLDVIRTYAGKKPILGVCLGHQAIGEVFGAKLINLKQVYHGVQTPVRIDTSDYLFHGLPEKLPVGRYHSWVVSKEGLPDCLEIIAESIDDQNSQNPNALGNTNNQNSQNPNALGEADTQIMALRHKQMDIRGIQFHPESVLTPQGAVIMKNWLEHNS